MDIRLSAIHLYPVKGVRGRSVPRATVETQGLRGDRRWMVVDEDGEFLSQRNHPRLALVGAVPDPAGLELSGPGHPPVRVDIPTGKDRLRVLVWGDRVDAAAVGAAPDRWLSSFLERPCRLAYMDDCRQRPLSSSAGRPGEFVSFADGYPVLLLSEASLTDLNGRLDDPLPMDRFRPNLVVDGCAPYAEDGWARLAIGDVVFRNGGLCARCGVTTVDQATGERPSNEPLRTLASYRKNEKGVVFGVNLIPERPGSIAVADEVAILD